MKALQQFILALTLTLFVLAPGFARADDTMDDLDVTMIVVDDSSGLHGKIAEMRGPDDDDVEDEDWREEEEAEEREQDREDDIRDDDEEEEERDDDFDDEEDGDSDFDRDDITDCLLYTSPSPRDA